MTDNKFDKKVIEGNGCAAIVHSLHTLPRQPFQDFSQ
jgi:hypothetical protein